MKLSIKEIQEMLDKISSWPWYWGNHFKGWGLENKQHEFLGPYLLSDQKAANDAKHDMRFIAASPKIISDLLNELNEAKKVLEWYASETNYHWDQGGWDEVDNTPISRDSGTLARQALERWE